jgi:hypothetical protein
MSPAEFDATFEPRPPRRRAKAARLPKITTRQDALRFVYHLRRAWADVVIAGWRERLAVPQHNHAA